MKHFVLITGTHVEDGKTYTTGDLVPSSQPLDKLFAGKFNLAPGVVGSGEPRSPVVLDELGDDDDDDDDDAADFDGGNALGTDVTANYPLATAAGLLVYARADGGLNVYESSDTTEPLNETPLTKGKVKAFINALPKKA